jgi:hypothetical protein
MISKTPDLQDVSANQKPSSEGLALLFYLFEIGGQLDAFTILIG